MVEDEPLRILLIEDNPGDARLIRETFQDATERSLDRGRTLSRVGITDGGPPVVTHETELAAGVRQFERTDPDVVLLDLDLPDSRGLDTLSTFVERTRDAPVVVLTGHRDREVGLEALRAGAEEYLVKDEISPELLIRSVYHAIEREKRETELQQYRTMVETIGDGVYTLDENLRFGTVNRGLAELTGYSKAELEGKHLEELLVGEVGIDPADYEWTLNEDRHAVVDIESAREAREKRPRGDEAVMKVDCPIVTADGEVVPCEVRFSELPSGNGFAGTTGVFMDISDRLEREREIRERSAAMEAAIDGVAVLDESGTLRYVNRAYADLHGYDDPAELDGDTWHRLYPENERERFEVDVLPTVREQGHWRGEATGVRADGTTFPQDRSLTALPDGGLVCVVRDITERKEHERRLETLNAASRELTGAETPDEVARTGMRAVEGILGFEVACVRLYDPDANALDPAAMTDEAHRLVESRPAFDLDSTLAGRAYRREELVHNVVDEDDPYVETPARASLHLPIGEHGVLTVLSSDAERFDDLEVSLGEALAASLRAALDRASREERLRENEQELRQQNEQLDTLYRITSLLQEVSDRLVEATTREELGRTVCARIADSELYRSAWVGELDPTGDRVDVIASAGLDDVTLEAIEETSIDRLGSGTVNGVLETDETQVSIRRYETETRAESADGNEETVEAAAAVPLAYGERVYGVLVVNSVREDVFRESALAGFESLGKLVGFALTALRDREIILSDAVVELDLAIADPSLFAPTVASELDCQYHLERSIPIGEALILEYHRIEGTPRERVLDLADRTDGIDDATVISERDGELVLQTTTEQSVSQYALEAGASVRSMTATDGDCRVTLEAPQTVDVRDVIAVFETELANVEFVAKHERERAVQTVTEFREGVAAELTEKQCAALEAAYAAGYYDWPREVTAEELAESMGVSSSTLHQHLRRAIGGLVEAFFEDTE